MTTTNSTPVEIKINARRYEDHDDCLTAAADEYAAKHDLAGWDLSPRWADEQRNEIILTVPAFAAGHAPR